MPHIEISATGRLDDRESAFPMAVQLDSGDILCSYGVGGGALVTGGTDWSRSNDNGETWRVEGTILPKDEERNRANFLKLTRSPDGRTIYAYGQWIDANSDEQFGQRESGTLICRSVDGGRTWSSPDTVPMPKGPLEVSHGVLPLNSGRLLAPAATLYKPDELGLQVITALSNDDGQSWSHSIAFEHPEKQRGYFEQKFVELSDNHVMGVAWTFTLGDYSDLEDSFVISKDGGATWGPSHSTGIQGQTMTPIYLGGSRLLVLYNQRHGQQAIKMCLVTFTDDRWTVHHESVMYDARTSYERTHSVQSGIDELDAFEFGFPTAIPLQDGSYLATHWCVENGKCGIRWTRLQIDWS
ncbi:MAG: sialidase family protein [Planctomycetaceae bacterium]